MEFEPDRKPHQFAEKELLGVRSKFRDYRLNKRGVEKMVELILMAISMMWFPAGVLLLGYGEARGAGTLSFMVGTLGFGRGGLTGRIFQGPICRSAAFRIRAFL